MSGLAARRLLFVVSALIVACSTYSASDAQVGSSTVDPDGGGGARGGSASGGVAAKGGGGTNRSGSSGTSGIGGSIGTSGSGGSGVGTVGSGGGGNEPAGGDGGMAGAGASALGGSGGAVKPTGLTLADTTTDAVHELNAVNTPFSERCPAGQVLVGFNGTVDDPADPNGKTYLRSAQAICGKLAVSASEPYTVTVTQADPLPMHEVASTQMQMALCPANQVMTGFAGRSGLWMDSVDVRCAPLSILGASPQFLLVVGTPAKAGTIGGPSGGSPFDPVECAAGDLAVGQIIRTMYAGAVLGAFGIECATASLTLGPG
ncbi:MAG TPA: hypothetical protein VNG33_14420 [Polyangiaceae bacterium]|nr:hypothetical protein [Polyangiaceae bacterium]